jgi:hypothetical protein
VRYLRRILRDHRPSPALVVASIALLVALGGTSVAAVNQLAANSVGTSQLKNNAVTTPKIKNSAVNASKIASNAVVAAKIASNAVASAKIASNAVTSAKIANATIKPEDLSSAAKTSGPPGAPGPTGSTGPAGPAGPSNAYARFLNGPIAIPGSLTTLASLSIPEAGFYVLSAKTAIGTPGTVFLDTTVTCTLEAGADFDQSAVTVLPDSLASLPLQVVHQFTAAGTANFRCMADGDASAAAIKITAIKVGSLVNTG